jgi:hypothetical protein
VKTPGWYDQLVRRPELFEVKPAEDGDACEGGLRPCERPATVRVVQPMCEPHAIFFHATRIENAVLAVES